MRHVWHYIISIWSHWVSRMSGIASIVFIAVALVFRVAEIGQARYWVGAAVVSYIVASFSAWRKEHINLRALSEAAANITATPQELTAFFEGRTALQGKKLASIYLGKWITVSGPVGDVGSLIGFESRSIVLRHQPGRPSVLLYFGKEWGGALSGIHSGDDVEVRGKVVKITRGSVSLTDCEIVGITPTPKAS